MVTCNECYYSLTIPFDLVPDSSTAVATAMPKYWVRASMYAVPRSMPCPSDEP